MPGVVSVFPNNRRRLHTTHSWDFMGLLGEETMEIPGYSTKNQVNVVIGFIDTGIWLESPSFSNAHMPPVPAKWKGKCESGEGFNASTCNRKIIGARFYLSGYEAEEDPIKTMSFRSPRDSSGHSSHTASLKLQMYLLWVSVDEDEDIHKEYVEETNRQAIMIAAAKLIANDTVPEDYLGPEIVSHFVMHGTSVAEIVKHLIAVLKKKNDDVSNIFLEALKRAYHRHMMVVSESNDGSLAGKSFKECKDLAARLSGTFVGAARNKHRSDILKIVKDGIEYAFVDAPKQLSFLDGAVVHFVSKLPTPDIVEISSDDADNDIDWNNLGFSAKPTDYMYVTKCLADGIFEQGQLNPYGNIELNPFAAVLNYGQGLFEGTKAFRRKDGRVFLFRPDQNAIRMQLGAERMCMPSPSISQFIHAIKQTALANRRWIPPMGKGSLYIRPLLIGSGPILGVAPSPEYTFLVYASPVGNYFKKGLSPLNLYIEDEFHRATRGGVGGVKSITNYAPVLSALTRAKNRGFSDVIFLDSVHKKNIEEATSCNVFVVKGNLISTPSTGGTILPGVTRKTVIDIARDHGYKVEERSVPVEELLDGDEVFCTGTAVGVAPVGDITYKGRRVEYKIEGQLVSRDLYSILVGIQTGIIEDKKGWLLEIE